MPHTVETLRKRPEFLACARARRQGTKGMLVQARARGDDDPLIRDFLYALRNLHG